MERFESAQGQPERREGAHAERVFLAQNAVQAFYAQAEGKSDTELVDSVLSSREAFRSWFDAPEGTFLMNEYARSHDHDAINRFEDIDRLIEEFESFRSRRTDTLH